ncbi:hypothetical protein BJF93_00375 [Xaviernesmea oryzae]|uniref:Low temperature requirement protein A n=1 Tax=Xaviernesmea oryzae TaxID=464029 RepID=A0A1Q9B0D1_9HYPH|nr:low temperature requirement protein A [Xaviernesmea oryzae]OLP61431.1 hypothetical protein BJF93_00375 [Xaviernesmea oryzae]SEL69486.1 Low temperature requirement protein LtrA [Xaviernesmea oryzae]
MSEPRNSWLRERRDEDQNKVLFPELFFDLVFVICILQVSHRLATHYDMLGFLETLVIMLALWWVWIFTTWVTNWLDADKVPVRIMLFALTFCGLLLASAVAQAFDEKALLFAGAYVAMQVGRSLFALYAFRGHSPDEYAHFRRVTLWLSASAVLWIAGALLGGNAQLVLWVAAILLEYVAPAAGFRVPGLGRSEGEDWDVLGAHMAERCALFVIICLGETILVTGRTLSGMPVEPLTFALAATAFLTTALMWWIYFHFGHDCAAEEIETTHEPGEAARMIFTYAHIPIVVAIILSAVGEEFVLSHPTGKTELKTASALIGAPAVFLMGNIWIKRASTGRMPPSHLIGLALLALAAPLYLVLPPYGFFALTMAVLAVTAFSEMALLARARSMVAGRGEG